MQLIRYTKLNSHFSGNRKADKNDDENASKQKNSNVENNMQTFFAD
jgi:hypothetical protein